MNLFNQIFPEEKLQEMNATINRDDEARIVWDAAQSNIDLRAMNTEQLGALCDNITKEWVTRVLFAI